MFSGTSIKTKNKDQEFSKFVIKQECACVALVLIYHLIGRNLFADESCVLKKKLIAETELC